MVRNHGDDRRITSPMVNLSSRNDCIPPSKYFAINACLLRPSDHCHFSLKAFQLRAKLESFLSHAIDGLNTLIERAARVEKWWDDIHGSLEHLEMIIPHIAVDGFSAFTTIILEQWEFVHQMFVLYQRQVAQCFPIFCDTLTLLFIPRSVRWMTNTKT